jgi:hypothetical protein
LASNLFVIEWTRTQETAESCFVDIQTLAAVEKRLVLERMQKTCQRLRERISKLFRIFQIHLLLPEFLLSN